MKETAGPGERGGGEPLLRIRGGPTAPELAAVVIALAPRRRGPVADRGRQGLWKDRTALVHAPLLPRPGAWRASGLPTGR